MNGGQPPVDPTATTMVGLTLRRTRKEFIIVTFRPGPSMMWEHWRYKSVVALEEVLNSSFGLLFSYLDQLTKAIHKLPNETASQIILCEVMLQRTARLDQFFSEA